MCGITGFIDFNQLSNISQLRNMVNTLKHRGPNDNGAENFPNEVCSVGLGQSRLSIIDLSALGHQPMSYKYLTIVFNGEIYNYKELTIELRKLGHSFVSGSDTEVILHAYEEWGADCVDRFIGMFAFAIFDKQKDLLLIFRDRAGVKPIYYYWENGLFLFGSELKSLNEHPKFNKEIDKEAVSLYFQYGHIPSPHSIYKNCKKLEPGHILIFNLKKRIFDIRRYWNVIDFYSMPQLKISYEEALNEMEELLRSACNYRMVADVPVGVFLSGGYDSTAVAAILQAETKDKLRTFTIGFTEGNNEATFAKETANYLGTEHTEYFCTPNEAKDIIPTLPFYFDEPFSDSSAIPTILVSRLARKDVTVALSADAGDEVFAGYNSYQSLKRNIDLLQSIPSIANNIISEMLAFIGNITPDCQHLLKLKVYTLAEVLKLEKEHQVSYMFDRMQRYSKFGIENLLIDNKASSYNNIFSRELFSDNISVAMAMDYKNYLPNDILTKVDRATMSVSLEGREPLLDHRLIEFAARLPINYKYDGVTTKRILKDIVYKYVPKKMMDRPKSGFSLPINSWLKGDLKPYMEEMLSENMIKKSGFLNYKEVTKLKKRLYKIDDDSAIIWKILQFQMWYNQWM